MKTTLQELTSQYPALILRDELARDQKIVYSLNGNRAQEPEVFLRHIEAVASKVGVARVADISHLSPTPFPVYQSCRPNLYLHVGYGQNSGAQGKGASHTQARISCIMETIESYCCEPRVPNLVRASYNFLRHQHAVLDPGLFVRRTQLPPSADEPLMWTPAYSLRAQCSVLLPAEAVYFPFVTRHYQTRPIFLSGTNGLASGATYLEATIHALYELIERYYIYRMEQGSLRFAALFEREVTDSSVQNLFDPETSDCVIQLYSMHLPELKDLPMIRCCLISGDMFYSGWGCSATVDISIARAISEALQCRATHISGSREDMQSHTMGDSEHAVLEEEDEDDFFGRCEQPVERNLHLQDLRQQVHDQQFSSLNQELEFIRAWLAELGLDNIFLANLTRHGVDIPVIKAIIPGLAVPKDFMQEAHDDVNDTSIHLRQFSLRPSA